MAAEADRKYPVTFNSSCKFGCYSEHRLRDIRGVASYGRPVTDNLPYRVVSIPPSAGERSRSSARVFGTACRQTSPLVRLSQLSSAGLRRTIFDQPFVPHCNSGSEAARLSRAEHMSL